MIDECPVFDKPKKSHQHRLVLSIVHHLLIGGVRGSKEVGWYLYQRGERSQKISHFFQRFFISFWHLVPPLAKVELASPLCVDGITFVWVDHHTKQAAICLRI